MKRGVKYFLLIALEILSVVVSSAIPWEEIQGKRWLLDTLLSAVVSAPSMLLVYTAGHDPKLKGWIPVCARILFWVFTASFVVGRIVPYVFA